MKTLRRRRIEALERRAAAAEAANELAHLELRARGAQLEIERERLGLLGGLLEHLTSQPDPEEAQEKALALAQGLVAPLMEALKGGMAEPRVTISPTGGSGAPLPRGRSGIRIGGPVPQTVTTGEEL